MRKICVVCYANYCRSPVAEQILSKRFENLHISSAGLEPYPDSKMDKRSLKFLEESGYETQLHYPKKLTEKTIKENDLILCLDERILFELFHKFPKYTDKFHIYTANLPNENTTDPFRMGEEEYSLVMKSIEDIANNLYLDIEKM